MSAFAAAGQSDENNIEILVLQIHHAKTNISTVLKVLMRIGDILFSVTSFCSVLLKIPEHMEDGGLHCFIKKFQLSSVNKMCKTEEEIGLAAMPLQLVCLS